MSFSLTIEDDHTFFIPRFEEELKLNKIQYEISTKFDNKYNFYDSPDKIKAKKIYDDLKIEFKYDIFIFELEAKLICEHEEQIKEHDKVIKYLSQYENEIDKIQCRMIYEEFKNNSKIKDKADKKNLFITSIEDVTYNDFMYNYKKINQKLTIILDNVKDKILNSDEYKIKKINLLEKILKQYNVDI